MLLTCFSSKTYETVSHSVEIDAYQCPEQPVPAYVLEEFYTGQLSCDSIENHVVKTEFLVGKGKLKAVYFLTNVEHAQHHVGTHAHTRTHSLTYKVNLHTGTVAHHTFSHSFTHTLSLILSSS